MQNTVKQLQARLPAITFVDGTRFYWSPKAQSIYMNSAALGTDEGKWALLHEAAHAQQNHLTYTSDQELLSLEVEAWHEAQKLGSDLGITIDSDHIQDCLDSYRDWLYARSTCPDCTLNGLQIKPDTYQCLNCRRLWQVSSSRFCRPYRMQLKDKKTPSEVAHTVFN